MNPSCYQTVVQYERMATVTWQGCTSLSICLLRLGFFISPVKFTLQLSAKADMKIQLTPIKPDNESAKCMNNAIPH